MKTPYSIVVALAVALAGCDNMEHQSNPRTFGTTPIFPDRMAARPVPAFTVPRQPGETQTRNVVFTGYENNAPASRIPLPVTADLLARGRERFNIYCAVCHGTDGYGRGIIVHRGFPPPPSFHEERLREAPVGHFFAVISQGYGVMYPYADRVAPHDRWAIVAYIRALQRSEHATLADAPADQRARLEAAR